MMSRARLLLLCVLFISVASTTGPDLLRKVGQSRELARLPYSERRSRVMGPFYGVVESLDRDLPPNERLAFIFAESEGASIASFANYYLYPRETRSYYLLAPWRNDPNRPQVLVLADVRDPQRIRRLDYLEIRRRLHLQTPKTAGAGPSSNPSSQFMIPLAGSLDGPGESDIYTVEGILESATPCEVTLILFPLGLRKTYSLEANKPIRFADVVGEAFGRMELGWLEITATSPVQSAFWYVDRARSQIEPLPVVEQWPALPIYLQGPADRIFVINPTDRQLEVTVNGTTHSVAPRAMPIFPALPRNQLSATGSVFAFATSRDERGRTAFVWPERAR